MKSVVLALGSLIFCFRFHHSKLLTKRKIIMMTTDSIKQVQFTWKSIENWSAETKALFRAIRRIDLLKIKRPDWKDFWCFFVSNFWNSITSYRMFGDYIFMQHTHSCYAYQSALIFFSFHKSNLNEQTNCRSEIKTYNFLRKVEVEHCQSDRI